MAQILGIIGVCLYTVLAFYLIISGIGRSLFRVFVGAAMIIIPLLILNQ